MRGARGAATCAVLLAVASPAGAQAQESDRLCEAGPRIREHINVFIDGERERNLAAPLPEGAEVHIIPAVAGG
jgi:molybdopterin converting factor small subunit